LLLILLSLAMLSVGGGVVPPSFGMVVGVIAAVMNYNVGKRGVFRA
jgi:hypothetical protein